MRRLNVKFLIILVVCTAVFIVGAVQLRGFNVGQTTRVMLEKGKEAHQNNDLRNALRYYTDYLRQHPEDSKTLAIQAELSAEILKLPDVTATDVLRAYRLLESALRDKENQNNHELRRKLVEVQFIRRMFQEARGNIRILEAAGETDADLDFMDAQCAFLMNDNDGAIAKLQRLVGYEAATRTFNEAQATAKDKVDAYWFLALILRDRKQMPDEADAVIEQMIAANPKSSRALLQRSTYRIRYTVHTGTDKQRKAAEAAAKEDVRKALELDPDNIDVLTQSAAVAGSEKKYDEAQKHLTHALKVNPKAEQIYLRLAGLMFAQKRGKEAFAYIEKGLAEIPTSQELIWALHQYHLQQGDVPAARKTVQRMRESRMLREKVALAQALIPMVEHKWAEAAAQLEAVRPQLGLYANLAQSADMAMAQCYLMLRQPDRQLEAFSRVLQVDPRNIDALRGKAAALTSLGRLEDAISVYQLELRPVIGAEAFLADQGLMLAYHRTIDALARRKPDDQRLAKLSDLIRRQLEKGGGSATDSVLLRAERLLKNSKTAEARTLLEEELKANPKEVRLQLGLVGVISSEKGPDAALAQLTEMEREVGDTAEVRKVRAELLLRKGGPDLRQKLADLEKGIDQFTHPAQVELWTRLGLVYYRMGLGAREEVRRCWQRALELSPGEATVMEWLFELARESGDNVAMLKARDDIEKAFGRDSSPWKYAEATRLVAQAREQGTQVGGPMLDEAERLVNEAAQQRPDWHMLLRLHGEINERKGEIDDAISDYKRSLELGPPNPMTVRRLVELQLSRNQLKEARETLERLGTSGMEKAEALVLALDNEPEKALPAIIRAVPDNARDPAEHLWKGQLLLRIGKRDQAEQAFRRAVELGPNLPQAWLTLVEFLVRAGKPAEAEETIRDAENRLTDDQGTLVLAQCYAMLGSLEQAEQYYLAALRMQPKNIARVRQVAAFYLAAQQPNKAAPYLKSIIDGASGLNPQDPHLHWARREAAILLAQSPSQKRFQEAVNLVELNGSSGTLSPDDTMLLARLHASRRATASLRQARQLLEQIQQQRSLNYEERLLLAGVYLKTNDWEKSRTLLTDLQSENPGDARVLIALANGHLGQGEANAAVAWVRKLEALQPGQENTIRVAATLAAKLNRPAEAEKIIDDALPKEVKAEHADRITAAAMLLENLELYSAAEKKYRQLVQLQPKNKFVLAAFLARRGRAEEAFELIKTDITDATVLAAFEVGVAAALGAKEAGKPLASAERDQVFAWLDRAKQVSKSPQSLLMQEATLKELLGQGDAERLYRQLLESTRQPEARAIVANNLAYLMAVQGRDLDVAQQHIDYAIEQLGAVPELVDTQAMIALARGNAEEAIKSLSDVTEISPTPELFLHLALAHQKSNQRAGAEQALQKARDLGLKKEKLSVTDASQLDQLSDWLKS